MNSAESRHVELPASPAAPRLGRQFVGQALHDWRLDDLAETVTLLTSEIVTNAVIHAGSASKLRVERVDGGVRVTVADGGEHGVAEPSARRVDSAGGHGLALVDTLADQWGSRRLDGRHEVWFELRA